MRGLAGSGQLDYVPISLGVLYSITKHAMRRTLTSVSGVVLAVPTQAAERHIAGVHKAVPERWLTYPYGASYLKRARRLVGYPDIIPYYEVCQAGSTK
jgi:hypothetical protein